MASGPVLSGGPILRSLVRGAAILAVTALAGVVALSSSIAQISSRNDPQRALAWAPRDAHARGEAAARLATRPASAEQLAVAKQLAKGAAARDPTVISAFRALGLAADLEGDREAALSYFTRASELSRRDRATQLWFLAHYQREQDETAFVRQFDVALRTSQSSIDELLPLLVSATAEPRILPPLRDVLATRPPWALTFTTQLISFGPELDTVVSLTKGRLDPNDAYQRSLIEALISRLVNSGQFGLAWQVFADAAPGARSAGMWGSNFETDTEFAPFGWDLAEEEELFAVRGARPNDDGFALMLNALNGTAGTVARRLLRLEAGAQRLSGETGYIPANSFDRPRIRVSCARAEGAGRQLVEVVPNGGSAPRRFSVVFDVPTGCRWQWLTIDLAGQEAELEQSPWLDNLTIRPVSGT